MPNERLAIDPGHPICTTVTYSNECSKALKPASSYLNSSPPIYQIYWDDVSDLLPGVNARYDVVMTNTSYRAFIANGLVIKARASTFNPGYEYY